ncbi:MAG TPA: UDP-N-acetylmuramate--L-alanine ligase [Candidatus Dormibacteraeota bacterium]
MTRIHLMPIGGVGVSALARVYLARGDQVSGCDLQESDLTRALEMDGVRVYVGHDPEHVLGADVLVYGSGVKVAGAAEIDAARAMGLQVLTRAEALAELIAGSDSVAVGGSAGKTTITHMLGSILVAAGWDPTVLVGDGANARAGGSSWLVAEVDESDGSIALHHPKHALLSNVDFDHPDHFTDLEAVEAVFQEFLEHVEGGLAVICADDGRAASLRTSGRRVTYGFDPGADYRCTDARPFHLVARGEDLGELQLGVPGRHNVLNATGAAAMALELGVGFETVASALAGFEGAHRRMERLGMWQGAVLYDDYAHHPAKVRAALAAARELPFRRLIVVFQPHRYSRTAALVEDFARSFELADAVLVTEVYGAGEDNPSRISGQDLANRIRHARFTPDFGAAREALSELVGRGDLVIFMGAGDIWKLGRELAESR